MAEIVRVCAVVVAILMRIKQKMAEKIEMVGISAAVLGKFSSRCHFRHMWCTNSYVVFRGMLQA